MYYYLYVPANHPSSRINEDYLRSVIFGLQDSLVSTTGVVIGLSATVPDKKLVLIASIITVAVEAISMAAGQYVSEKSLHQLNSTKHRDNLLVGSLLMLVSYSLAGMIPIVPITVLAYPLAPVASGFLTLLAFVVIGLVRSRLTASNAWRNIFELLGIGGTATLVGVAVGFLLQKI